MRLVKHADQTVSIFNSAGDQVFTFTNRFSTKTIDNSLDGQSLKITDTSKKSYQFRVGSVRHLQNEANGEPAPGTPFASMDAQDLINTMIASGFFKIQ